MRKKERNPESKTGREERLRVGIPRNQKNSRIWWRRSKGTLCMKAYRIWRKLCKNSRRKCFIFYRISSWRLGIDGNWIKKVDFMPIAFLFLNKKERKKLLLFVRKTKVADHVLPNIQQILVRVFFQFNNQFYFILFYILMSLWLSNGEFIL